MEAADVRDEGSVSKRGTKDWEVVVCSISAGKRTMMGDGRGR